MKRKVKVAIGLVVGVVGLASAAVYRVRYERDKTIPKRQRRLEEIIRMASSEDADIFAD